jgi:polysaccharide pyruvyl transferase WcaK-like protein
MIRIALIDPSLKDNSGKLSTNLGDIIIYDSISELLNVIFKNAEIKRISSQTPFEKKHYKIIKECDYTFIGGTNILSSNIREYNQWVLNKKKHYYLFPKIKNVVLMGVGWWQYQQTPTFITKIFYKKVLSKDLIHSLRDNYTKYMLDKTKITNSVNTSCPTCWNLNNRDSNRKEKTIKSCVFTLTDYNQSPELDSKLIEIILQYYTEKIFFFPQGLNDLEYINSLDIFKNNKSRIKTFNHSVTIFDELKNEKINYIGTRLHGGIKFLQQNKDSIIIGIDNRSKEISKDINLPVIERSDLNSLKKWIEFNEIFKPIKLPIENIDMWKNQFYR